MQHRLGRRHHGSLQPRTIHTFLKVSEWNLCSPSATWLSRINTVYCLNREKIQPTFDIHPMRYKQLSGQTHQSHCTYLNKNATQFSFACAATTNFLKPWHAAAGGTQVSGSLPAGHWCHLSSCSRGTQLRFCVLGVFAVLRNCGRHGSDVPSTCWTKLGWVILSELPFPVEMLQCRGTQQLNDHHHNPQPKGNLLASLFSFYI